MERDGEGRLLTRRELLGYGAVALAVAACSGGGDGTGSRSASGSGGGPDRATPTSAPRRPPTVPALTAADFAGLGVCMLLPAQMAGPFPLEQQFHRRDITEGVPGQPMRLGFRVVDADCTPVPGASVEVWHCDASGDYSAFKDGGGGKDEAKGTTFLRGTQTAGDDGIVEFATIVPGWYKGRAVHVHYRVRVDGGLVLTSQAYFDPGYLARVYAGDPYREFGPPDTSNEKDAIAGDPGTDGTLLHTTAARTRAGRGTLALLNLGVDPTRTA